jgi:hypothetical protein
MVKKRATKSVKTTRKVKSLSLSAQKAKGVRGGSLAETGKKPVVIARGKWE